MDTDFISEILGSESFIFSHSVFLELVGLPMRFYCPILFSQQIRKSQSNDENTIGSNVSTLIQRVPTRVILTIRYTEGQYITSVTFLTCSLDLLKFNFFFLV